MPIDRRTLLATGAAAGLTPALSLPGHAQAGPSGAEMRERMTRFLASLNAQQADAAQFSFNSAARPAWNFMLGARTAPGLPLERMSAPQKDLALDVLATATSATGLEKSMNIMLQQDILRDEWGKGAPDRNRERFSVQVYGTPAARGAWGWRWEGHHLSLSFTLVDDVVVSTTPSSYSSEPNTVPSGPHRGLVVLKEEEALGRALFQDLSRGNRRAAVISRRSLGNIQSNGGAEVRVRGENAGVALGDLPQGQADIVRRLIEVYTTEVLPAPLARQQAARIAGEDEAALRFAWAGADLDGSIYYRITGANLLIEFASLPRQPLHLHAVFHDTARNFGRHVL